MTNDAGHSRAAARRSPGSGEREVLPDAAKERDRLAARLRVIQQQRLADEVQGNELPQLCRAIVRARRDRDSGMSQRVRAHRDHLERVFADAENLVFTVMEVNLFIHVRGFEAGDPLVREARKAIRRASDAVDQLNRDLVGAGL
jgi:hypothetical protein